MSRCPRRLFSTGLAILFIGLTLGLLHHKLFAEEILRLPEVIAIGRSELKVKEERKEMISPEKVTGIKEFPEEATRQEDVPSGSAESKVVPYDKPSSCCIFGSPIEKLFSQTIMGDKGYYDLGRFKYQQGEYREAFKIFLELGSRYPGSSYLAQAHYWAAEASYQVGDWDVAAFYYRYITEHSPRSQYADYAFYSLGWIMD